jgi:hypothetical protein
VKLSGSPNKNGLINESEINKKVIIKNPTESFHEKNG